MGFDTFGLICENSGVNRDIEIEMRDASPVDNGWINLACFQFGKQSFIFKVRSERDLSSLHPSMPAWAIIPRQYCVIPDNCSDYDIRDLIDKGICSKKCFRTRQGFIDYFVDKTKEIFYTQSIVKYVKNTNIMMVLLVNCAKNVNPYII